MKIEEIINNLISMKDDFIPTTSKECSGIYNVQSLLDSLTSYTKKNDENNFQSGCLYPTFDTWTTVSKYCPIPNLINERCKLLKNYYPTSDSYTSCIANSPPGTEDPECEAIKISNIYSDDDCTHNIKQKIKNYSKILLEYYIKNNELIEDLLGNTGDTYPDPIDDTSEIKFYMIKNDFQSNFIVPIKTVIKDIDEKLTSRVYEVFNEFLNDTTEDTYKLRNSEDFNIFSWMNCSAIGQDYNATLSTLKSSLTKELKIITYVSLFFEFLSIANLYIMVGLTKNLRDKKYEKNEEKNVSIEEIDIDEIKETKNEHEIYSLKNKK
jgi:hypothetical protein